MAKTQDEITRDAIREAFFKSQGVKSIIINYLGQEVEVKKPTLEQRNRYLKASVKNGEVDMLDMQLHAIIECCFVPGGNTPVFTVADYATFKSIYVGEFTDVLWETINKQLNVTVEEVKKV